MAKTGLPTAEVTRTRIPLTPEVIAEQKAYLTSQGLPAKIYKFEADGDTFIFRPLYRGDWNEIQAFVQANQSTIRQDAINQKICEKALLWPEALLHPAIWEVQRAGIQDSLAKFILAHSCFLDPDLDQSSYLRVEPLGEADPGPKPSEAEVAELKAKFNWTLRAVKVDQDWYVVRPLNRAEWKQISSPDELDIDLAAAERATVWSREYPARPAFGDKVAGTVRALSEVIMAASGFLSQPTVEEL
jgi:hypothetical protein